MTIIDEAREFAKARHEGQFRRDGKPYFTHLEAVAKNTEDILKQYDPNQYYNWDAILAASFLHDTVEMGVKIEEIDGLFGTVVANMVLDLTRKENESYFDYIIRIDRSLKIGSLIIKIADLTHNLNDGLGEGSMKDKYRFAKYILEKSL